MRISADNRKYCDSFSGGFETDAAAASQRKTNGAEQSISFEITQGKHQNPLRRSCYYTIFLRMTEDSNLKADVEGDQGILVIRGSSTTRGWNGIRYKTGLSGKNVGARKLSMNVATIPPGGVAYAHIHVDFEVMLYILEGRVRHEYGPGLSLSVDNQAGDFIFIEPGIPHEVCNLSETQPVVAVVARSDASEWEHIADYPSKRRPSR